MSGEAALSSLAQAGFTLAAPLATGDYNACVPEAWRLDPSNFGGVWIVGNAGRLLWPRFCESAEFHDAEDPLDHYTRRCFGEAATADQDFALYSAQRDHQYLPLIALAETAGLGVPGRVGVLLHPEYGPWISLRGVLFVAESLQTRRKPGFDPCTDCAAPCESACHGGVVSASGVDVAACYQTRQSLPDCALRCDARAACVLGPEHAFERDQVAHHSRIRPRR